MAERLTDVEIEWFRTWSNATAHDRRLLATIDALTAERDQARARVGELEAALMPFAEQFDWGEWGDTIQVSGSHKRLVRDVLGIGA